MATQASKIYSTDSKAASRAGGVPVKTAKELPGNQGAKNSHTKPGTTKENGSPEEMRETESVTSTKALKRTPAGSIYPHLKD